MKTITISFPRLVTIIDELREKCPWDKVQTMETLRLLTIEETYELGDAILEKDYKEIRKELGDLLMHVVFYARIASEQNLFNIDDVINAVSEKLIHRHPHVYGETKAASAEDVKKNWEQLKIKEGNSSVLQGVPVSLPALVKAYRIQEKVKAVGFDWERVEQVWKKVEEELAELKSNIDNKENAEAIEAEFGDVLFALINYARFIGVDPENALERTNKKFIRRFQYIEKQAKISGKDIREMTLAEMDGIWEQAKKTEE